ncbi:Zn(2)-C6 fungal-type DNA-binding domain protein [Niveomyces insectorum RCEF 264]|uniref:Zn(2)-C6 fungal-type DNA-binding domain protein n=1 Tax=Niveomyces insectorum RCEF 264 TaxID=1081102 RepID=A0A167P3S3_9HYPO|nr:Zn(2)-C6 fungal-type DNA-binding domain protein [Niveomyces insectorum RCEF 264]
MNTASTSTAPLTGSGNTRSPLACLPCRSRHLKCDGGRPRCNRCVEATKPCQYAKSRRGGLDRAALAERRRRREAASQNRAASTGSSGSPQPSWPPRHCRPTPPRPSGDIRGNITDVYALCDDTSSSLPPAAPRADVASDIAADPLIASYYKNFHRFHPLILPHKHLVRLQKDPVVKLNLTPLLAILRFIGHIYDSREWSAPLRDRVEICFAEASATDPIMVQCRLLYSIALFWNRYEIEAMRERDAATRLALDLQMFRRGFAAEHGEQDAVLTECWRRTWWMLYMVDAFYAGTLGTMNFATMKVDATVDLPCEESDYEQGEIPEPSTLQDFDCRDLGPESASFSSFAYLIGAVRCAALAISTAPKVAATEDSTHILQAADAVINGWLLLLPKGRKQVMSKTGEVDELMFQAHLLIHVATIGLHRPLSDLKFSPAECVSSCAREPPRDVPAPELVNVHTVRVLRSVEAQIRLLALPTEQFHHSPFTTCMVSEGALALLSACTFLLKGTERAIARDQIRMTIGCLKALGELWPRTAKNVQEIQTIAPHVLGLEARAAQSGSVAGSGTVGDLLSDAGQQLPESDHTSASDDDVFASLGTMEDVCGWYNSSELGQNLSWWVNNPL